MLPDYYAILGIPSHSTISEIKKAYREKAKLFHPDRGGSHENMVLINEAFAVLSDANSRPDYDCARNNNPQTAHRADDAIRTARKKAADYPAKWSDFEVFLRTVANDFANAEYGFANRRSGFPKVQKSISGITFLVFGALAGGATLFWLLSGTMRQGDLFRDVFLSLLIGGSVGAWLGLGLHAYCADLFRMLNRKVGDNKPSHASSIINCTKCGQKLRLPSAPNILVVTCPSCRETLVAHRSKAVNPRRIAVRLAVTIAIIIVGLVEVRGCVDKMAKESATEFKLQMEKLKLDMEKRTEPRQK